MIQHLVVVFDIPEIRRTERQKFRRQLRRWNFTRVQQSVWKSNNLPLDFESVVERLELTDCVRVYNSEELSLTTLMKRPLHKREELVKSREQVVE